MILGDLVRQTTDACKQPLLSVLAMEFAESSVEGEPRCCVESSKAARQVPDELGFAPIFTLFKAAPSHQMHVCRPILHLFFAAAAMKNKHDATTPISSHKSVGLCLFFVAPFSVAAGARLGRFDAKKPFPNGVVFLKRHLCGCGAELCDVASGSSTVASGIRPPFGPQRSAPSLYNSM